MDGRTDMKKLTVALRNFKNAPNNFYAYNATELNWKLIVSG